MLTDIITKQVISVGRREEEDYSERWQGERQTEILLQVTIT